ncbi:hypothetical protein [Winogradskyella ursingii]|uniref:hypothetical protein n=1 Tax=Winogradskyella ursingii TaxID=2686079 RepID=UPI0015CD5525|nr:hypothetical protein [Winogradskyella ursingii]
MDNPFKQLNAVEREVPKELKAKVMKDIAMAKLVMDIAELFSYNLGYVIDTVIETRDKNNNT